MPEELYSVPVSQNFIQVQDWTKVENDAAKF